MSDHSPTRRQRNEYGPPSFLSILAFDSDRIPEGTSAQSDLMAAQAASRLLQKHWPQSLGRSRLT
jgi:hypothetical protein